MEGLLENLNLRQVRFEQVWLIILALEVVSEFGNVVDLDVVLSLRDEGTTRSAPAVVVSCSIVTLVLLLFRYWELEEMFRQGELLVNLLLSKAKVLDVKLVPGKRGEIVRPQLDIRIQHGERHVQAALQVALCHRDDRNPQGQVLQALTMEDLPWSRVGAHRAQAYQSCTLRSLVCSSSVKKSVELLW